MKRRKKGDKSRLTLGWLLTGFMLAILLNAGLMTSSAYMLIMRTGILKSVTHSNFWPMLPALMCMLLVLIFFMAFGRYHLRPVHRVIKAMKQVSKGDFSTRLNEDDSIGEIQELIASYNHMAEELSGIEMFRSDFINNFSHEFKTPIVSIRGFARQLERDDLTEEQRKEYTRIIASESERLANMSSNVLLLTKLENQQIICDRRDFALDEQIRNCILLLEKNWSDKDLELQLDLDPLIYNGNEEMMSHVWLNLLGNAIKFSPEGAVLEVGCMRVQDYIVAHVRDQGPGMDEITQSRIFEKFYQGDTAHAAEGNGLGLSLVKRIVELCGGKVVVQSAPDQGTTFSVYLPVEDQEK